MFESLHAVSMGIGSVGEEGLFESRGRERFVGDHDCLYWRLGVVILDTVHSL